MRTDELRDRFARLHQSGTFLMPNAWDVGSARIIESLGFEATATTSSGFAASLGRLDQQTTLDELLEHVRSLTESIGIPVSVDAEHCFAETAEGVGEVVGLLAQAGAAGVSIEDFIPGRGVLGIEEATRRVASAAEAAGSLGLTLSARAENHLYDRDDLDDTIERLISYRDAGAGCLYAPGLSRSEDIRRVVGEVGAPVNVLLMAGGPSVPELSNMGVRRLSVGGTLTFVAYGALIAAARELQENGITTYEAKSMTWRERMRAFAPEA